MVPSAFRETGRAGDSPCQVSFFRRRLVGKEKIRLNTPPDTHAGPSHRAKVIPINSDPC